MNAGTTADILADLIAFPTVSQESNRALIDYCAAMLGDAGIDSRIIENDDGSRANLFATIGPADSPGVMLSGHTDVVPVDGQSWTRPPFRASTEDGRIYGRGTADMKGFVAAALMAARGPSRLGGKGEDGLRTAQGSRSRPHRLGGGCHRQ